MNWLKNNWVLLIVVCLLVSIFLYSATKEESNTNIEQTEHPTELVNESSTIANNGEENTSTPKTVYVDVKGEVEKAGVYEIEELNRVSDVITLAGGFTKDADTAQVNLAQKVFDEMVIYVPKLMDHPSEMPSSQLNKSEKLRINYASVEEIATLNGIGEVRAKAIVQYREENGYFQKIEDLLEISGIGKKTLEKIKDDIQIP